MPSRYTIFSKRDEAITAGRVRHTLLLSLVLSGCATSSTLFLPRGTVEATIAGGDDESLLVTTESGLKRRVRRENVLEIDHPGNVVATVFGVAGGFFGVASIALAATSTCRDGVGGPGPSLCIAYGALSAALFGVMALGLWNWLTSKNALMSAPPASEGELGKVPFLKLPGLEPAPCPELLPVAPPAPP